jgi:hypothetical protein
MKVTFSTKKSIKECVRRIEQNAVELSSAGLSHYVFINSYEPSFFYSISDDSLRLERAYAPNNTLLSFNGKFVKVINGTKLEGELKINPFFKIFISIWFGFLSFMLIILLISSINSGRLFETNTIMILRIMCGMLAFGIIFTIIGRMLLKFFMKRTIAFLEKVLEAKVQYNLGTK